MKDLVVYFSRGDEEYNVGTVNPGNTELLAKEIIKQTGADEFKIVPVEKYPEDYQACVDLATQEKTNDARPAYQGDIDLADYDRVFLGYPIWWSDLPMIVYSFLDNHDFTGKTVVPFNTHEGSGNASTYQNLKAYLETAILKGDGFNLPGHEARTPQGIAKLNDWLKTL